jgi:putative zinc finger/helix-turn-helix YgiT family protein
MKKDLNAMINETQCLECEHGTLVPDVVEITGYRNGEEFAVRVPGLRCTHCDFKTIDNSQSAEFTKAVSDAFRNAHGLLTGTEIRERRARLEMSQRRFAEHLGVGPASVKRWERGLIQEKAMDELIRLKTDPNAARRNLKSLERRLAEEHAVRTAIFCDDTIELSFSADQSYSPQATVALDTTDLDSSDVWSLTPSEQLVAA